MTEDEDRPDTLEIEELVDGRVAPRRIFWTDDFMLQEDPHEYGHMSLREAMTLWGRDFGLEDQLVFYPFRPPAATPEKEKK